MFDEESARLLRSAPSVPDLETDDLPAILANAYAGVASRRLSGESPTPGDDEWPLSRIADVYELITSVSSDRDSQKSAAFVAGSAQRLQSLTADGELASRAGIHPSLTAPLLFLIAEQYADAADAANEIPRTTSDSSVVDTLVGCIAELSAGRPGRVLDLTSPRLPRRATESLLEARATEELFLQIIKGIRELARRMLGLPPGESPAETFRRAIDASTRSTGAFGGASVTAYPGPSHLAELLLAIAELVSRNGTVTVPHPPEVDGPDWQSWLRTRARRSPFIWPNHRSALLDERFHDAGKSAVIVYPTGGGKTALATYKVQATLMAGQKVVFLAPTHALAEQLTREFHAVFAESVPDQASIVFDSGSESLAKLEVMTPERCLARLSHSPESFDEVGLLVFDECHLLSPDSGMRRSLDAMLCLLGFNAVRPEADLLLLSAMLTNGAELSDWIQELTGRPCLYLESYWKPTRQARAVVTYLKKELDAAIESALEIQRALDDEHGKTAKGLRAQARRQLTCTPYGLFGLQHNWLSDNEKLRLTLGKLSEKPVQLGAALSSGGIRVTPNANAVAGQLASQAVSAGLKTIIFVNSRRDSLSVARSLAESIPTFDGDGEADLWAKVDDELGGSSHSVLVPGSGVVPHNALMLRSERELAEALFRNTGRVNAIVATPTLAQGLNLPASLAIIAGDKRMDQQIGQRTVIKAHELLNAAGRAGRAGYLANGVVLLVPEPVVMMPGPRRVSQDTLEKLQSVMPPNDRCLEVRDPLERILDSVVVGSPVSGDVEYSLNRMQIDGEFPTFTIRRSLAAYQARRHQSAEENFNSRLTILEAELARRSASTSDQIIRSLSARTGISAGVFERLIARFARNPVPQTVIDWSTWTKTWLSEDEAALLEVVGADTRAPLRAAGRSPDSQIDPSVLSDLHDAIEAWLLGLSIAEIEAQLTATPPTNGDICIRARELVLGFLPRAFSHAVGIAATTALLTDQAGFDSQLSRAIAEIAPVGVREGLPTPVHIAIARLNPRMSRRQVHTLTEELAQAIDVYPSDTYQTIADRVRLLGEWAR